MKQVLFLFTALLLIMQLASADMGAYPSQFLSNGQFTGQLVVGNDAPATDTLAAIEVSGAIQQQSSSQIRASTEDEYDKTKSAIAIGQPCKNKAVADIMGTSSCDIGLEDGQGYIKLIEKDGLAKLVVTGKTAVDTRKAARVLAKYGTYQFTGNDIIVTGTLDAPQVASSQNILVISKNPMPECSVDSDCKPSEYCSSGKCTDLGCPEGTEAQNHDCTTKAKPASPASEEKATAKAESQPQEKAAATASNVTSESHKPSESRSFFSRILSFFKNLFR